MDIRQLSIKGYARRSVPHRFLSQERETDHLAVILPGSGYTCDMPLLYYTVSHLLDLGADVLQVEYAYAQQPEYRALSVEARTEQLLADVTASVGAALDQRTYRCVTVVGKSLGTRAMPHLLTDTLRHLPTQTIWYTPLLNEGEVLDYLSDPPQPVLVVIGTVDPHYSAAAVGAIRGDVLVIEGAEHALEITGDIGRSIQALERAMLAVQQFVVNGAD